jgi:hypothetical protein
LWHAKRSRIVEDDGTVGLERAKGRPGINDIRGSDTLFFAARMGNEG